MMQQPNSLKALTLSSPVNGSNPQLGHAALRFLLTLRYHKNAVIAVMLASGLVGILYYATTPRRYASKAVLLVTQMEKDRLDASLANDDSLAQNTMPTFEKMIYSAKVIEGALQRLGPKDRIDLQGVPQERWATTLQKQKNLSVRTLRRTGILEVTFVSLDRQAAANVVRAIIASYTGFMNLMHKNTIEQLSRMLTQERVQLADQLNRKQEELLNARRQFADMGFRSDGKTLHPMVQRAVFFNDSLITAQKQSAELESLVAVIEEAIRNGQDVGQYLISVADAVGRELLLNSLGLGSRTVNTHTTLKQTLFHDRAQLHSLQQNLGPMHPEVIALSEKVGRETQYLQSAQERLSQRVAGLRQSQLGNWLAQMVRQKLEQARQRERMLQVYFEGTRAEAISLSSQMAEIERLERDVKRLGDMNDALLNQIAAIDVKQNGSEVRVAVLEDPEAASAPFSPRLRNIALLTLAAGLVASLLVVNVLDVLDDRFRSPEEMQSRLNLPLMSTIPQMAAPQAAGIDSLVTFSAPTNAAVEGFRTLRTTLSLTVPDAGRLAITSAEPGDGKTTILANLAVCSAQAGKRILLIDADLRRPGLSTLMNLRGRRGLSEILQGEKEVEQMAPLHTQHSPQQGLDVLPCGARPSNPAELLGGLRFSQLLAWAETAYDQVLIDTPPILATTDTAIVGRLIDGVLLVVRPEKNRRHLVLRASERLSQLKIGILGVVINGIDTAKDYGYGYGYGYGGYHAYGGYGYGDEADASQGSERQPGSFATTMMAMASGVLFVGGKRSHKKTESRRRDSHRRAA